MQQLWLWRVTTLVACLGWTWTAWTRVASTCDDVAEARQVAAAVAPARVPAVVRVPVAAGSDVDPGTRVAGLAAAVPDVVPAAFLERAREEVRAELAARRRAHDEERLDHMLDDADAFAEAHDLSQDQQADLERALIAMHERMQAVGPPDPLSDGPPSPLAHERMEANVDQLDDDLRDILGDDLAEAFHAETGPPGRPPPGPR
ncbi:MAG: hypothetical protein H6733_03810 [Alphaproteobacteria bacterium]|nr:hypothetical protein [Alphaproteobacteria bacterium]